MDNLILSKYLFNYFKWLECR